MLTLVRRMSAAAAGVVGLLASSPAFAQWQNEIKETFTVLESGLVDLAAFALGAAVIIVGAAMAFSGRLDGGRLGATIAGGILIMFGPTALRTLVGAG